MFERQNVLKAEFKGASDRAAAIVGAAFLDELLTDLLTEYLIADTKKNDKEMFSGGGPLSTFSAKINMCYRLGLISKTECKIIHCIRNVRNKFAHKLEGVSFDDNSIKQQVLNIAIPIHLLTPDVMSLSQGNDGKIQTPILKKAKNDDVRGLFQEAVMHMLSCLNGRQASLGRKELVEAPDYTEAHHPMDEIIMAAEDVLRNNNELRLSDKYSSKSEIADEINRIESKIEKILSTLKFIRSQIIKAHEERNYEK